MDTEQEKILYEQLNIRIEQELIKNSIFGHLTPSDYKKLIAPLQEIIDEFLREQKILKIYKKKIRKSFRKTYSPFFQENYQLSSEFKNDLQEIYNEYPSNDKEQEQLIFEKLKNRLVFWQIAEKIKEQTQQAEQSIVLESIKNIKQIKRVEQCINILFKQFKKQKCRNLDEVSSDESQSNQQQLTQPILTNYMERDQQSDFARESQFDNQEDPSENLLDILQKSNQNEDYSPQIQNQLEKVPNKVDQTYEINEEREKNHQSQQNKSQEQQNVVTDIIIQQNEKSQPEEFINCRVIEVGIDSNSNCNQDE